MARRALAEHGSCLYDPGGSVRVLTTVLAYARNIALDVTRMQRAAIKGRREQQDKLVIAAYQMLIHGSHARCTARSLSAAPERTAHDCVSRVDPALVILLGTQRRAVVEKGAAIPAAVPGVLLDGGAELVGLAGGTGRRARGRRGTAAKAAKEGKIASRNQPTQTLSPLPPAPT